jgi:hypothetical protein
MSWIKKIAKKQKKFSKEETKKIGDKLNIDWNKIDINEMVAGMAVELEHGTINPKSNITNDDPVMTFKIVLAHMFECSDYYTRLKKMENSCGN